MGDRVLTSFVGRGNYKFSTHDAVADKTDVSNGIPYDFELEGYWSFVYFGYKRFEKVPRGVGYVYFTNLDVVKRVEFNSAKHYLLRNYARFVVGKGEFGHQHF